MDRLWPSASLSKIASAIMMLFFCYGACVQLNDPDWLFWFPLWSCAALASFLYAEDNYNLKKTSFHLALAVMVHAAALLGWRVLCSFLRPGHCQGSLGSTFSVNSEVGRENIGSSIIISWMTFIACQHWAMYESVKTQKRLLRRFFCSLFKPQVQLGVLVGAALVLSSIWVVPKFVMDVNSFRKEESHCYGLGFSPECV